MLTQHLDPIVDERWSGACELAAELDSHLRDRDIRGAVNLDTLREDDGDWTVEVCRQRVTLRDDFDAVLDEVASSLAGTVSRPWYASPQSARLAGALAVRAGRAERCEF